MEKRAPFALADAKDYLEPQISPQVRFEVFQCPADSRG